MKGNVSLVWLALLFSAPGFSQSNHIHFDISFLSYEGNDQATTEFFIQLKWRVGVDYTEDSA